MSGQGSMDKGRLALAGLVLGAVAGVGAFLWLRRARRFGGQEGRIDRRHPAADEADEMLARRKDDGVGGED